MQKDEHFADIYTAHVLLRRYEDENRMIDNEKMYKDWKAHLAARVAGGRQAARRSSAALRMMGGYSCRGGLLYKDEWDSTSLSFVPKVVAPRGGLRSFRYNG
eukprot:5783229-Pyramimonas_sp.AAC.1